MHQDAFKNANTITFQLENTIRWVILQLRVYAYTDISAKRCIRVLPSEARRCTRTHFCTRHHMNVKAHTCVALGGEEMHVHPAPRVGLERIRLRTQSENNFH